MDFQDILYRVEDGVAVITLNRPDRLNAWRGEMDRDVRAAMRLATDDAAVRVIVLTGAGRGFCAGADMNALTDDVHVATDFAALLDRLTASMGTLILPDTTALPPDFTTVPLAMPPSTYSAPPLLTTIPVAEPL